MLNTLKRYRSSTFYFFTSIIAVFLFSEVIAQADNPINNNSLNLQVTGDTVMTKALSNRLGQVVDDEDESDVLVGTQAVEPQPVAKAFEVAQATVEPIFSERTANHLNLAGQSPNDPSRKRITLGDFNGDGVEDLIVSRWTANAQLFINNAGVLTLTDSAFANFADTADSRHAGVLDANGDGWLDLVLRNKLLFNLGEDGVGTWLGFDTGQTISGAELDPFTIQSADFDGDGDIDVATSPGRRMLVNNGSGTLVGTPSRMGSSILLNVIKFDAQDFDGDGDIDLAGPEISEQNHYIYYNDGAGNFTNALRMSLPLDTLTYTQVGADFNGDNIADFRIYADNQFPRAFMSTGAFNGNFPQYIRRNDGDLFGDNGKHGLVHIRDIDDDGDLDFILSSLELFIDRVDSLNEKTEIIVNKDINSGTFEVFADVEYRDEESFDAKITDVNLDGNMDLFIAHQGRLAVYINDAPPKIIEITGQTNTPSEAGTQADFNITVSGVTGSALTTWDMGDGNAFTTGSDFFISHTYSAPGRYLVTVSVDNGVNIDSLVFWHTVFEPKANFRPNSSTTIVYEDLGGGADRVWSVNPDHNTVSAVTISTGVIAAEINVGTNPTSLAFGGDGRLYVVNKDDDTVSVINTSTLAVDSVFNQLPAFSKPHGIVFNPIANSQQAFVTLEATGQLAKIDFATSSLVAVADVAPFPRELSTNGDGSLVYVSRFITPHVPGEDTRIVSTAGGGEVRVVDSVSLLVNNVITLPFNNQPDAATSSRGVPNYLMAPITSPSGLTAFVPANVSNIYRGQFRDGQNREHNKLVRSMLAKLDLQNNQEEVISRHDFDNSAQPTAGAFDPTGNYLYLVFEASRKLRLYDVHAGEVLDSRDVGFAPRGVTVSPDGTSVVVDNYLSRTLHVFDASEFVNGDSVEHNLVAEVNKAGSEPLSATLLLGKQLFFDAADERLSAQSYISCATCHADGGHDGRTWDFSDVGEGLRNTIDLRGRSGMGHGLVHWTANFNEIQDFENDIRDIFQGSGLMSNADFANTAATLGSPKTGLSSDLDALAAFVASLSSFGPSPYLQSSGAKTPEAIAGEQVFANSNCASCHSGSQFTDSPPGGNFHDIGTVDADTGGRLGAALVDGGLDTPTLKGLWHGEPYLHDGSAATVKDAILAHTSAAVGFDVSSLSALELDNLEAYLLQLSDGDAANIPPLADAGVDQTETDSDNSGSNTVVLDGSGSNDSDGSIVSYAWSSDTGVVIADGESTNGDFAVGVHNVTLTVTDNSGSSSSDTMVVTVNALVNNPPVITNPGSQSNQQGDNVSLQIVANDPDSGDTLSFSASGLPSGLTMNASGLISGVADTVATSTVNVSVTDAIGASDSISFSWTVTTIPNIPPVANAGTDQSVTDTDENGSESIQLDGASSSDSDGSIASYIWTSDTGVVIPNGVAPSADFPIGVHTVTLVVTDNDGSSSSDTVLITVLEVVNVAPIADVGADQTVFDDDGNGSELVILPGSGSTDSDGTIVLYTWSADTGVVIPDGETPSVNFPVGVHTVTLTVTDDDGATGSDTVIITVEVPINNPPTLTNPGTQSNSLGDNVSIVIAASDPDAGDTLTFSQTGLPDGLAINSLTGEISGILTVSGTFNATVTVTDNSGDSSSSSFDWNVVGAIVCTVYNSTDIPVNLPNQVASVSSDLIVNNPGLISDINISIDMDHDWIGDLKMTLTHQDTNTSVVVLDQPGVPASQYGCREDDLLITLDDDATADTETTCVTTPPALNGDFAPSASLSAFNQETANGTWVLTIEDDYIAADAGVLNNWSVEICADGIPVNEDPIANAGVDQNIEDADDNGAETIALDGSGSNDSDGNIVSYAWSSDTGVVIPNGITSNADFPIGVHVVTLTVTDNVGAIATDSMVITVTALPNAAPVANAGADQSVMDLDDNGVEAIVLDGSGSNDSDGNIISYTWSSDTGETIPNGSTSTVDFPIGVHVVTLTVTDNEGATATDSMVVTVTALPNAAPVANAGADQSVMDLDDNGVETIVLDGSGSDDSDGNIVSYLWSSDTAVVIPDGATSSADFPIGVHIVTLTVTDDDGATATDILTVTVEELPNVVPIANAGVDQTVSDADNSGLESVSLNGTGSNDSDGNLVSFAWSSDTGVVIPAEVTPTADFPVGIHAVTLTVTDNEGATATDSLVVIVTAAPNVDPVANAGVDQAIVDTNNSGAQIVTLDGSASTDNDGTIASYSWSSDTGTVIPTGVTPSAEFSVGVHTVTLTVTDDDGATSTDTMVVTVTSAPNTAPVIVDPGAQANLLGDTVSLTIAANDPDVNDTLTFSQVGLPDGLNIDGITGEITGTTSLEGMYNPEITVTDNNGGSNNLSFQWTVQAGVSCTVYNSTDIPVALPNQVAAISSDLLVSNSGMIVDVNVSVEMTHDWIGDLKMTLTHQNSNTSVVVLDQPGVPASQYGCREDDILMTLDDDATGNTETTCVTTPPALNGNFAPSASLSAFNQLAANGTWVLTVEDDYVAADAGVLNNWSIEICTGAGAVNEAPTASAGSDQTVADTDNNGVQQVNLDGSASTDSDGTIVSYNWSADSGVVIPDGATPTVDFPVGVHTVTLVVTDDDGATGSDTTTINVEMPVNNPPSIVNPGAQSNSLGETVSLTIAASDPDAGNTLTFTQTGLPDGLAIDSISGEISGVLAASGNYNPTITVTDNLGASSNMAFNWGVVGAVVCTVYNSADIPVNLPNQVASITSDLLVNNAGQITDVNVSVNMDHNWIGDLIMTLTHQETNTSVVILDQPGVPASQYGCREDDISITLDDDATGNTETTCGTNPPALNGNFSPSTPLSAFNQQSANGTWVLKVDDDYVAADAGVLNSWSVEICTQ